MTLRRVMRKSALLSRVNSYRVRRHTRIIEELLSYSPNSAAPAEVLSRLAIQSVRQSVALMYELSETTASFTPLNPEAFQTSIWDGDNHDNPIRQAETLTHALSEALEKFGSDKSTVHNYHLVYAAILGTLPSAAAILEFGLGTNNEDVPSTMGRNGRPGASLRAWHAVLPDAQVLGADIDKRILFDEPHISTFHADQTDDASMAHLLTRLPEKLDLIIDDGLHSPNANLRVLLLGLRLVTVGGWIVIEDIRPSADQLWAVIARLVPAGYRWWYVRARAGDMFVVRRLA
ncbi:hypothetical protein [uncultured Jatrophihabitans sp.]|uniref:hypothetical protein n=1 Tax=uncultured Jatrophihabitans sp. TaxID=1610747 RepID=UPI0035CB46B5